jgi:hypothetical protein
MVCSVECALNLQKGKMSRTATWKHSEWLNALQSDINRLVRLIDTGQPCMSQGTFMEDGMVDAGHYMSRGSTSSLRFHLLNIWAQSKYANQHLGGDYANFRKGLVTLYGEDRVEAIEELKSVFTSVKWSIPELKDAREVTRHAIKDLSKLKATLSHEDRWSLRVELNDIIGLYDHELLLP